MDKSSITMKEKKKEGIGEWRWLIGFEDATMGSSSRNPPLLTLLGFEVEEHPHKNQKDKTGYGRGRVELGC